MTTVRRLKKETPVSTTEPVESAPQPTEAPAPSTLPEPTAEPANSVPDDEFDDEGFIKQQTAQNVEKGPFLVGISEIGTERRITRQDFASVGIEQDTLIFEWKRGYKLPLEGINPAAVEFLCATEYGFSVSDE